MHTLFGAWWPSLIPSQDFLVTMSSFCALSKEEASGMLVKITVLHMVSQFYSWPFALSYLPMVY